MSKLHASYPLTPATRLEIAQGDLTQEKVDAIVNAANEYLSHGGGIAEAISHAGGPAIDQESAAWVNQHGPVTHEKPAYTSGGHLPARYVIHAVGPVWGSGDEDSKLAAAITGSLRQADALGLRSIAFPAISTGIFHFPKDRAARVAIQAIKDYFAGPTPSGLTLVRLVLWDDETLDVFLAEASRAFSQ